VTPTTRTGQSGKTIEEVVGYAVGHRIRVQVLSILNEGTYTPDQLAKKIDEPLNKVSHHIRELVDAGSIELVKVEKARNADQHYYRAVEMPFYSDEDAEAMPPQQRKVIAGLCLQGMMAEAMSAFWAGKLHDDPREVLLAWRWFNLDECMRSRRNPRTAGRNQARSPSPSSSPTCLSNASETLRLCRLRQQMLSN
jgi:DNA-binding transcriptional ArsR family regulator